MAVGLEDANRSGGADPVRVQEDHDLANSLLLGPARHDARRPPGSNARHLGEALWAGLDDLERALAEGGHETLGHGRADAAHLTRGEIALDPLDACGRRGLEHVGLELKPMHAITDPSACGGDPLPSPNC